MPTPLREVSQEPKHSYPPSHPIARLSFTDARFSIYASRRRRRTSIVRSEPRLAEVARGSVETTSLWLVRVVLIATDGGVNLVASALSCKGLLGRIAGP